jgi:hypothetical protein
MVVLLINTHVRFNAAEEYVPLLHLDRFNSNFNAVMRTVKSSMVDDGVDGK